MNKEIKLTHSKINTILTATTDRLPEPTNNQLMVTQDWCSCADRVIVHSNGKPTTIVPQGFRLNPTRSTNPTLADIFRAYLVQIPGGEVFAIAAPNVRFNPEQRDFFSFVNDNKMERAWASYLTTGGFPVPQAFVISAPILGHIMVDIPPNLTFDGEGWAVWLHDWCGKFLMKHRYFDGSSFEVILPIILSPVKPAEEYDLTVEPPKIEAPEEPVKEPLKKRKK